MKQYLQRFEEDPSDGLHQLDENKLRDKHVIIGKTQW